MVEKANVEQFREGLMRMIEVLPEPQQHQQEEAPEEAVSGSWLRGKA